MGNLWDANEMEWPNDPDEPISNIGRFCLLENIEEAHPTDVAYEEGADGISYLGLKNISGTLHASKG